MDNEMLDLEEELGALLGDGRAARLSMRLRGFDGRGGTSLRQLADETGLSYERIRQLSTRPNVFE
jgi:DNA-directed RNA polymerase sigma subunit (sigma70/sigma32)